jgi:hypothetical protein
MTKQERLDIVKRIIETNGLTLCTLNIEQFNVLTELDLFMEYKTNEIVTKIKRYEEYIGKDKMKYPERIMRDVRKNLGLDEMDSSEDLEIYKMDRKDVLNAVCTWNNLPGYGSTIIRWVEEIYQIKLIDEI